MVMCDEETRSAGAAADSVLPWQRSQRPQRSGHAQPHQDVDKIDAVWKPHRPKYRCMICFYTFVMFTCKPCSLRNIAGAAGEMAWPILMKFGRQDHP